MKKYLLINFLGIFIASYIWLDVLFFDKYNFIIEKISSSIIHGFVGSAVLYFLIKSNPVLRNIIVFGSILLILSIPLFFYASAISYGFSERSVFETGYSIFSVPFLNTPFILVYMWYRKDEKERMG